MVPGVNRTDLFTFNESAKVIKNERPLFEVYRIVAVALIQRLFFQNEETIMFFSSSS